MLLQHAADAVQAGAGAHPLSGTVASYLWLLPLLPLLGFVANGLLAMLSAGKLGPADPSASHGDDHAHAAHGHDDHGHGGGEHDDHHTVVRHKYASLTSL